jgi:DNA-binding SARP family transcriptional activator
VGAGASVRDEEGPGAVVLPGRRGEEVPQGELAELLWPRSDRRSARTDLRSALSKFRKALGEGGARREDSSEGVGLFAVEGDLLRIVPEGVELDLTSDTLDAVATSVPKGAFHKRSRE